MGMVSRGPERRRLRVLARGGVVLEPGESNPREVRSGEPNWPDLRAGSGAGSELTTTIGGTGDDWFELYLRSGTDDWTAAGAGPRLYEACAWDGREWLALLLTDATGRPWTAGTGWGRGLAVFGGGGGGADAAVGCDFTSFVFADVES